jgi:hypothetical protein
MEAPAILIAYLLAGTALVGLCWRLLPQGQGRLLATTLVFACFFSLSVSFRPGELVPMPALLAFYENCRNVGARPWDLAIFTIVPLIVQWAFCYMVMRIAARLTSG